MAEIFGRPLVGDLPKGWTAMEAVVLIKAATPDEFDDPVRYLALTTDTIRICDAIALLKAGLTQLEHAAADCAEETAH